MLFFFACETLKSMGRPCTFMSLLDLAANFSTEACVSDYIYTVAITNSGSCLYTTTFISCDKVHKIILTKSNPRECYTLASSHKGACRSIMWSVDTVSV